MAHLILTFGTANGGNKRLRIPNPRIGLTGALVRGAMVSLQTADVFNTSSGAVVSPRSASLVEISHKSFDIN